MKFKIFLLSSLFLLPSATNALVISTDFGGPILGVYECTCTGGLLVIVEDYRTKLPLSLLYEPFVSRLNQNFNIITPGVATLGNARTPAVCSMGTTACFTVPVVGIISPPPFPGVGTGATPMFLGN